MPPIRINAFLHNHRNLTMKESHLLMETTNKDSDPQMNNTLGPFLIKDSLSKTLPFVKGGFTIRQQEN